MDGYDSRVAQDIVPRTERFELDQLQRWAQGVPTKRRGLLTLASLVMLAVFGFGGVWSATAHIGGAVVGMGRVVASGNNEIVQHLEGGILKEILVKAGDVVEAGDVLARLDTVSFESQYSATQVQRAILYAELARWRAESKGLQSFDVDPSGLAPVADNSRVIEAIESQSAEFEASRDVKQKRLSIIDSKIAAANDDIRSLQSGIDGYDQQLSLIGEEHEALSGLLEKGLTSRPRVLALERSMAQLESQRASAEASIQKGYNNIDSLKDEKRKVSLEYNENANQNITRVQRELNSVEDLEARIAERLSRSTIRSPANGIVFRVYKTSKGAVLQASEPFVEIFPSGKELAVKAAVAPKDIGSVQLGQEVSVVFPSDQRSSLMPLNGSVTYISTDSVVDDGTGQSHYIVEVTLDPRDDDRKALPGNTAQVYFKTDPQTFFEILATPISRFARNSFSG